MTVTYSTAIAGGGYYSDVTKTYYVTQAGAQQAEAAYNKANTNPYAPPPTTTPPPPTQTSNPPPTPSPPPQVNPSASQDPDSWNYQAPVTPPTQQTPSGTIIAPPPPPPPQTPFIDTTPIEQYRQDVSAGLADVPIQTSPSLAAADQAYKENLAAANATLEQMQSAPSGTLFIDDAGQQVSPTQFQQQVTEYKQEYQKDRAEYYSALNPAWTPPAATVSQTSKIEWVTRPLTGDEETRYIERNTTPEMMEYAKIQGEEILKAQANMAGVSSGARTLTDDPLKVGGGGFFLDAPDMKGYAEGVISGAPNPQKPGAGAVDSALDKLSADIARGADTRFLAAAEQKAQGNRATAGIFFAGAIATQAGLGAFDAATTLLRPSMISQTAEGLVALGTDPGGVYKSILKNPQKTIPYLIGGVAGGYLGGKALGKGTDILLGKKGKLTQLTEVEVSTKFDSGILVTEIKPTTATKNISRKAYGLLSELDEGGKPTGIVGTVDAPGFRGGYELSTGVDDLMRGKSVKTISGEGAPVSTPKNAPVVTGLETRVKNLLGEKTQALVKNAPEDIFKEVGLDSPWLEGAESRPFTGEGSFKIKVVGGVERASTVIDDLDEIVKVSADPTSPKTSLNETFGYKPKASARPATPKTEGPAGLKTVSLSESGLKPVTSLSPISTGFGAQGSLAGLASGISLVGEPVGGTQTGIRSTAFNVPSMISTPQRTRSTPTPSIFSPTTQRINPISGLTQPTAQRRDFDVKPVSILKPIQSEAQTPIQRPIQSPIQNPIQTPMTITPQIPKTTIKEIQIQEPKPMQITMPVQGPRYQPPNIKPPTMGGLTMIAPPPESKSKKKKTKGEGFDIFQRRRDPIKAIKLRRIKL